MDLGSLGYKTRIGGLYPNGSNTPPAGYLTAGLAAASLIQPLDSSGNPSGTGKIGLVSCGMSNAKFFFDGEGTAAGYPSVKPKMDADPTKNPKLLLAPGCVAGQDASGWADIGNGACWSYIAGTGGSQALGKAGLASALQVQAAWLCNTVAVTWPGFEPGIALLLGYLEQIVANLLTTFPNLKIVYLSDVNYFGYSSGGTAEPWGHETAWAFQQLVADRINNVITGPWIGWAADVWTDGLKGRNDGLQWLSVDSAADGVHPSTTGSGKAADKIIAAWKADPTATWMWV